MRTFSRLTAVAALTGAALLITGCTATADATTNAGDSSAALESTIPELADDQKVEIVFESYNLAQAGVWSETINTLIGEFEDENPNITVTAQPTQGGTAALNTVGSVQTQMLAGSAPDVAQITFDSVDFAVNELGAQPVEKLVGTAAVEEAFGGEHPFHPRAAVLGDWDGVTYAMPYVFSTPVLWYNATALEAAGLPADVDLSTWDAVKAASETVTKATGKPSLTITCAVKGGSWCMQGLFKSNGGAVLSDDRSTIEFGSPESIGAVEELRELYDDGVLANLDSAAQYEAFSRGDSVIQLQTSVMQSTYMAAAEAGGWELKNTVMPAFGDKEVVPTNSGSALFMFSQDPAKQRAAWEFMKFMTSDRAYEVISTGIGYLPLRPSLTEGDGALAEWTAGNPLVAPNLAQLDNLSPWVSYPGNSYVQVDDILATAIEDAVFYGKDPEATMTDAAERAQSLIEK
jgi:multiple sugar transport system substrate-binding protein